MSEIIVIDRAGAEQAMAAQSGLTLMEVIRNGGSDEMLALCGGSCACATCHVILDPDGYARFAAPSEVEGDLLDSSEYRVATSRLSCQLTVTDDLDGLRVTIAPED
jgi:2Fe-2S ferredoxin